MKGIIVGCAGGLTSSLLCDHIIKAGQKRNLNIKCASLTLDIKTNTLKETEEQGIDIFLIYCGATDINRSIVESLGNYIKGIYIAPQVRYLVPKLNKELKSNGVTCKAIDMRVFGRMDGEKMLDEILEF